MSIEDIAPLVKDQQPESILIHGVDGIRRIYPKTHAPGASQSDKTLFITSHALIQKISQERISMGHKYNEKKKEERINNDDPPDPIVQLPYDAYAIASFAPGTRHDGSTLVPIAVDYRAALKGPDYSFDPFPASDSVKMKAHLSTVLPLGNDGSLVLQVGQNGSIVAHDGFDFAVYQTTFRISETDFWQKFSYIGISNTLDSTDVKWFPCAPMQGILIGCVGVVPTDEGGDQFSLASIGVQEARYIWIKDVGFNFDIRSKWPTEGCALDALRIYHGYTTQLP